MRLYRAAVAIGNPQLTSLVFTLFNDPGLDYSVPVFACLGYVWLRRRTAIMAAAAALGLTLVIGAWTIDYTHWFGFRPRPFILAPDVSMNEEWRQVWTEIPSFPSGHIRELSGLSLVLIYFWPRSLWFALPYLGLIAFTRVYIGAHFPSDVVAGIVIGLLAGTFSLVSVDRVIRIIRSLGKTAAGRRAFEYISEPQALDRQTTDSLLTKSVRAGLFLALLLAATFLLGSLIYTETPRILADYLRNTDSSLVYPIFKRFDPAPAQLMYWLFADGVKTYPALVVLILGFSAFRGRKSLGQAALMVLIAFITVQIMVAFLAPHFERPRPLSAGEGALPQVWQHRWPGLASFPDSYLVGVMALSSILARSWVRLLIPAHLYPFLVSVSLFYFGAVWPTDALASLVVGYWVARYSLFLSQQVLPWPGKLGNNHPKVFGDDAAGKGDVANGPPISMGGQG